MVGVGGWGGVIIGGVIVFVVIVDVTGKQRVVTLILQPGLFFTSHKSVSRFFILLSVVFGIFSYSLTLVLFLVPSV